MGVTGAAQLAVANAERQKVKRMTLNGSASGTSSAGSRIASGRESGGRIDVEPAEGRAADASTWSGNRTASTSMPNTHQVSAAISTILPSSWARVPRAEARSGWHRMQPGKSYHRPAHPSDGCSPAIRTDTNLRYGQVSDGHAGQGFGWQYRAGTCSVPSPYPLRTKS